MRRTTYISVILLCLFLCGCRIETPDAHYKTLLPSDRTVTVSARCDTVLAHRELLDDSLCEYIPDDGILISETLCPLYEGDTAFSVLERTARICRVPLDADRSLSPNTGYVKGIGYLYEFSCGAESGWMYKVNGIFPEIGSYAYPLQPDDTVEWLYTTDLGHDLGKEVPD